MVGNGDLTSDLVCQFPALKHGADLLRGPALCVRRIRVSELPNSLGVEAWEDDTRAVRVGRDDEARRDTESLAEEGPKAQGFAADA